MATDPWADFEPVGGPAPAPSAFPGIVAGRPKAPPPPPSPPPPPNSYSQGQDVFTNVMKLRDDYNADPSVKSYRVAVGQLAQALNTGEGPQNDLALTYAFAKAMDPDSVVREAEQGMVADSQPWFQAKLEQIKKQFGADGAGNYTPEARQQIRAQIINAVKQRDAIYNARRSYYESFASKYGFDPVDVIGEHDGAPFRDAFEAYDRQQRGDGDKTGSIPGATINGGDKQPPIPGVVEPTREQTFSGGIKWGDQWSGMEASASDYLSRNYGVDPGEEAEVNAFWNANRGNKDLTVEGVREWYQRRGMRVNDSDIAAAIEIAQKPGVEFKGSGAEAAEAEYKQQLDQVLKQRGSDPESVSGTVGISAAQGVFPLLDETAGVVGGIKAAVTGQNPIAGYMAERDVLRREQERAETARPILSGVSNVGGALLTGGVGFKNVNSVRAALKPGAITGAAYGFATGEGLLGSVANAGVGAVGGAALSAGAQYAGQKIAPALAKFIPERPLPTQEQAALVQAGERMEVPLRQADVRPELRGARSAARTGERGGPIIREAEAEDVAAMAGAVDRELGGPAAPPANREAMGDILQDGLDKFRSNSKARIGADYGRAHRLAGDVRITPAKAVQTVDEQIADLEAAGPNANRGLISYLRDVREDLSREGGMTVDALRNQRTNMRGQIDERKLTQTDAERRVGMVLDSAADDIAAGLAGKPRALEMFRKADQAWRYRSDFLKQIMEKVTGPENNRRSGSAAASTLEGWIKGDFKRFRRLWTELDRPEREAIQAHMAETLGRNGNGEFSTDIFISNVAGRRAVLSKDSARLIFGERGLRALDDLQAIAKAKQAGASETNRSKTGNTVQVVGRGLRTVLLAQLGFAAGDVSGAVLAPAAGSFLTRLGERRAARMLTNPDFTGWLRRLPDTDDPRTINRQFAKLDSIAARSPSLAGDVEGLKQSLLGAVNDNTLVSGSVAAEEQNEQPQR